MSQAEDFLIYGAGGLGREILAHLKKKDRAPLGFIDRRAAEIGNIEDIAVYSLPSAVKKFVSAKVQIIVAIHNFGVSVADILNELRMQGFDEIITVWQFCQVEKWLPEEPYWLSPLLDWRSCQSKITAAYALLQDDISRELFSQLIRLRTHGDFTGLSSPDFATQYDVAELPDYVQPIRLIDCGAYDGDTIRSLLAKGNQIEDLVAFEPDKENFEKLKRYLDELGYGSAINSGTFDRKGEIKFSESGSGSSHIDFAGSNVIEINQIDEACHQFTPTLIKMDVEGAEAASIRGAEDVIRTNRPALAISIYHKPEDLWELILMVNQLDLGYRIYLRIHGHNGFDTVMYAFPS